MPNQYTVNVPSDSEIIAAYEKYGSKTAAGLALGIHRNTVSIVIARVQQAEFKARGVSSPAGMAVSSFSESFDGDGNLKFLNVRQSQQSEPILAQQDEALPGFAFKRISTNYGPDGRVLQQWQIQSPERAELAKSVRSFVEGICEGVKPAPLVEPPRGADNDLLCVYPMGDPHFGMRAHAPEAGENFDLKIAEANTKAVVDKLVSRAPPAKKAILLNLGDFFHADDNSARTKQSGNPLDVDGRWHEVLKVGGWTMVHLVNRLLEKHEEVEVVNERGNHDDVSAIAMAVALDMFFHNNPRVIVSDPAPYFHFTEFGVNLIGSTHGDGPKEGDLPGIMAHDQHEAWGRTKHRVFHRGHFHHDRVVDLVGCTVETHRTLAASDAWHRKSGYRSKRDMKVITYHRLFGEEARTRVNLDVVA